MDREDSPLGPTRQPEDYAGSAKHMQVACALTFGPAPRLAGVADKLWAVVSEGQVQGVAGCWYSPCRITWRAASTHTAVTGAAQQAFAAPAGPLSGLLKG